jgi:hypothetical protein
MTLGRGGIFGFPEDFLGSTNRNPFAKLKGSASFSPLALLQQLVGEPTTDEIIVRPPQERPEAVSPDYEEAPPRDKISPRYVLNDDRIAPTPEELEEIVPRKGMFGVKGTLRDVLGTLGDAFLVQSGNNRVYAPQRQQEKEADALFGFTQDPMQAIERLAVHNPEAAKELYNIYEQAEARRATLASQEGARQDVAADRRYTNILQARNQVARWMQAAGDNPNRIAFVYQQAERLANELGAELNDLGLPGPNMSPDERAVLAAGDMTVNQQSQIPFRERQLDISQQNADSARIAATRPRNPPPRPRADTELEYYRDLSQVPENERTPEEKAFMKRYIEGTRGRRSRIGNAPPPPSNGRSNNRFRIVN